jgi:hypothetical protein
MATQGPKGTPAGQRRRFYTWSGAPGVILTKGMTFQSDSPSIRYIGQNSDWMPIER